MAKIICFEFLSLSDSMIFPAKTRVSFSVTYLKYFFWPTRTKSNPFGVDLENFIEYK